MHLCLVRACACATVVFSCPMPTLAPLLPVRYMFPAVQVHKLARVTGFSVYWRVDDKER